MVQSVWGLERHGEILDSVLGVVFLEAVSIAASAATSEFGPSGVSALSERRAERCFRPTVVLTYVTTLATTVA